MSRNGFGPCGCLGDRFRWLGSDPFFVCSYKGVPNEEACLSRRARDDGTCRRSCVRTGGFLVYRVDGGAWFPEDSHQSLSTTRVATISKKMGYDADVNLGYDFGSFRLEAEYSHKKANNDTTVYSDGVIPPQGGMVRTDSGMINGYLDFGRRRRLPGLPRRRCRHQQGAGLVPRRS